MLTFLFMLSIILVVAAALAGLADWLTDREQQQSPYDWAQDR